MAALPDNKRQAAIVTTTRMGQFLDLLNVYLDKLSPQGTLISDAVSLGPVLRGGSLALPTGVYNGALNDWATAQLISGELGLGIVGPWPFRTDFGVDIPVRIALPNYLAVYNQLKDALDLDIPKSYVIGAVAAASLVLLAFWRIGHGKEA